MKAPFEVLRNLNTTGIRHQATGINFQFARWLTKEVGVACIPASAFYQEADKQLGRYFARFAVCKKDETLARAAERLARIRSR